MPTEDNRDLKVFISHRDSSCDECHEPLGRQAWIVLEGGRAFCLACAETECLSDAEARTRRSLPLAVPPLCQPVDPAQ